MFFGGKIGFNWFIILILEVFEVDDDDVGVGVEIVGWD